MPVWPLLTSQQPDKSASARLPLWVAHQCECCADACLTFVTLTPNTSISFAICELLDLFVLTLCSDTWMPCRAVAVRHNKATHSHTTVTGAMLMVISNTSPVSNTLSVLFSNTRQWCLDRGRRTRRGARVTYGSGRWRERPQSQWIPRTSLLQLETVFSSLNRTSTSGRGAKKPLPCLWFKTLSERDPEELLADTYIHTHNIYIHGENIWWTGGEKSDVQNNKKENQEGRRGR